jgi:hypothetical protein
MQPLHDVHGRTSLRWTVAAFSSDRRLIIDRLVHLKEGDAWVPDVQRDRYRLLFGRKASSLKHSALGRVTRLLRLDTVLELSQLGDRAIARFHEECLAKL